MPASKRAAKQPTDDDTTREDRVCPVAVCPVGMFLTLADQARPEVVEHLLAAGRELMLAVTALMDARADAIRKTPSRVERIEVE